MKHLSRSRSVVFGAVGVIGIVIASILPATPSQAQATPLSARQTRAQHLRAEFGLDASASRVRMMSSVTGTDTSELGIPLTPAETAELKRRDAQLPHIFALQSAAASVSTFAGLWIDQAHGGKIIVQFTQSATASQVAAVEHQAHGGLVVTVRRVARSLTELKRAQSDVLDVLAHNSKARSLLQDVSVDVKQNVVYVDANNVSALRAALPAALLTNPNVRFRAVTTKWFAQSRDITTGPAYGGEWTNGTSRCTIGYSFAVSTYGNPYTMTAGHCDVVNGSTRYQGHTSTSSSDSLGTAKNNTTLAHGIYDCDCEAVGPIPAAKATNKVLTSDTATFAYGETATGYTVGERACLSGAAYGDAFGGAITCGQMTDVTASETYNVTGNPFTLTDSVQTDIPYSSGGDSGGPYGNGTQFLGIHAAGNCKFDSNGNPVGDCTQTAFSKSTHLRTAIGLILEY